MAKNYYMILGLSQSASTRDIKSAYHQRAMECHPDQGSGGYERFLDVQEAYSILSDPQQRSRYDRDLGQHQARGRPAVTHISQKQPEPLIPHQSTPKQREFSLSRSFATYTPSYDEIFDWLWRNYTSLERPKSGTMRGLQIEIPLSRQQAQRGGQVRLMVPAQARCPTCRGYGLLGAYRCYRCGGEGFMSGEMPLMVSYPAGIRSGHTLDISLARFGIENTYLKAVFRIADSVIGKVTP